MPSAARAHRRSGPARRAAPDREPRCPRRRSRRSAGRPPWPPSGVRHASSRDGSANTSMAASAGRTSSSVPVKGRAADAERLGATAQLGGGGTVAHDEEPAPAGGSPRRGRRDQDVSPLRHSSRPIVPTTGRSPSRRARPGRSGRCADGKADVDAVLQQRPAALHAAHRRAARRRSRARCRRVGRCDARRPALRSDPVKLLAGEQERHTGEPSASIPTSVDATDIHADDAEAQPGAVRRSARTPRAVNRPGTSMRSPTHPWHRDPVRPHPGAQREHLGPGDDRGDPALAGGGAESRWSPAGGEIRCASRRRELPRGRQPRDVALAALDVVP